MSKYDFFIAGRWRNKENVGIAADAVRGSGYTAYCFIDNAYSGSGLSIGGDVDPDVFMKQSEIVSQDNPLIREIFEADMTAERDSDIFLLVLPAGIAAHIESGVAYGMGKKCYAVGALEKTETLYCIFEQVFDDMAGLRTWLQANK